MNEIKIKCTFSKNDFMTVDHMGKEFGIDFWRDEKPVIGILMDHEQAKEIVKFIEDNLD